MGDPQTNTRWRAAHTVRLLIGLGCSDELETLNRLVSGTLDVAPFIDAELPFYDKHALLWLLLALARAANDPTPTGELEIFVPLLKRVAFVDPPHVLLRAAAASALLGLAKTGVATITVETATQARALNTPTSVISISRHARRPMVDGIEQSDETVEDDDLASFFWDFTDHLVR